MAKLASLFALLSLSVSLHAAALSPATTPAAPQEDSRTEELVRNLTNKLRLLPHQTYALRLHLHGKAIPGVLHQRGTTAPASSFEASLSPAQLRTLLQLDEQQFVSLR